MWLNTVNFTCAQRVLCSNPIREIVVFSKYLLAADLEDIFDYLVLLRPPPNHTTQY